MIWNRLEPKPMLWVCWRINKNMTNEEIIVKQLNVTLEFLKNSINKL